MPAGLRVSLRRRHLARLKDSFGGSADHHPAELLEHWQDGMVKMFIAWKILELRHRHRELFLDGNYVPLETTGTHADHLCSFVRQHENRLLLVCVPRLTRRLIDQPDVLPVGADVWGDTGVLLPSGCASKSWSNVLTGETVETTPASEDRREAAAANLLRSFPVAVLQALL